MPKHIISKNLYNYIKNMYTKTVINQSEIPQRCTYECQQIMLEIDNFRGALTFVALY